MDGAVRVDCIRGLWVKVTDWIVGDRCQVNHSIEPLEVTGRHIPDISGPLLVSVRRWAEVTSVIPTNIEPDYLMPGCLHEWNEYGADVAAVAVDQDPHESLLSVNNIIHAIRRPSKIDYA